VQADQDGLAMVQGLELNLCCNPCADRIYAKRAAARPVVEAPSVNWDGVPVEYQDSDPERFPPHQWQRASGWVPASGNLHLCGPSRRCKTRIAYALVMKYRGLNRTVAAYDCRTIRAHIEQSIMGGSLWSWYDMIKNTHDIIMIDDIGKFKADGKRIEEELFNLIKLCCEWKVPIISTANADLLRLRSVFSTDIGKPLIERMLEQTTEIRFWTEDEESKFQTGQCLPMEPDL